MIANVNIKTDKELKVRAEALFEELGMNMTTAINVFLKQAVYENRIPFSIYRNEVPNKETQEAMKEAEDESKLSPAYSNMKDLIEALHA